VLRDDISKLHISVAYDNGAQHSSVNNTQAKTTRLIQRQTLSSRTSQKLMDQDLLATATLILATPAFQYRSRHPTSPRAATQPSDSGTRLLPKKKEAARRTTTPART